VHDIAFAISQDLHLDVLWLNYSSLEVHAAIAESGFSFTGGFRDALFEFLLIFDKAHAAATAAGQGLSEHRVFKILRRCEKLLHVGGSNRVMQAWPASSRGRCNCCCVIAGESQRVRGRSDKGNDFSITRAG